MNFHIVLISELLPKLWQQIVDLLPDRDRSALRVTCKQIFNKTKANNLVLDLPPELRIRTADLLPSRDRLSLRASCRQIRDNTVGAYIMPKNVASPKRWVRQQLISFLMGISEIPIRHLVEFKAGRMHAIWQPQSKVRIAASDTTKKHLIFIAPLEGTKKIFPMPEDIASKCWKDRHLLFLVRGQSSFYTLTTITRATGQQENLSLTPRSGLIVGMEYNRGQLFVVYSTCITSDDSVIYSCQQGSIACYCFGSNSKLYIGVHIEREKDTAGKSPARNQLNRKVTNIIELDLRTEHHTVLGSVPLRIRELIYREVNMQSYLIVIKWHNWGVFSLKDRQCTSYWHTTDPITASYEKSGLLLVSAWSFTRNESTIYGFHNWWVPNKYRMAPHILRRGKVVDIAIIPNALLLLNEGIGVEVYQFV